MKRSVLIAISLLSIGLIFLVSCSVGKKGKESSEEKITLTWYMRGDAERMSKLEAIKEIERKTGIQIEFITPSENEDDSFKLMLASGNLPDIIQWKYSTYPSKGSVNSLYLDGIAVELTELIKQYAPNLSAIYEKRPEIISEVLTLDEKLLYFPKINPMLTKEEIARKSTTGLIIRYDWIERLGLTMPTNIDEWYMVLSAFKNGDPNKNGLDDEIPFDGSGIGCFTAAFGILDDICIKDGKVVFGPIQQEYKDYLNTMKLWYDEGLIGKDSLAASDFWMRENIIGNVTGSFKGLDNAWSVYLGKLQEKNEAAQLAAVPWPMDKNGVKYTVREDMATHLNQEITIITSNCKYPEKAVELIDFFYSEEGETLMQWGIKGETFEVVNGEKRILEEALVTDSESGRSLYYQTTIPHLGYPKYSGEVVIHQLHSEEWLEAELVWADADTSLIYPPSIIMSQQEAAIVNELLKDINYYVNKMQLQFIAGLEPISNFDNYVEVIEKMGIKEIIEIYQKNYIIFQKRMNSIKIGKD